jgi:hypothetical protein
LDDVSERALTCSGLPCLVPPLLHKVFEPAMVRNPTVRWLVGFSNAAI